MNSYKIEAKIKISIHKEYSPTIIAESEVCQTLTLPASKVREAASQLIRQTVSNMSTSAETGLKELIEKEPIEIGHQEEKELTI